MYTKQNNKLTAETLKPKIKLTLLSIKKLQRVKYKKSNKYIYKNICGLFIYTESTTLIFRKYGSSSHL